MIRTRVTINLDRELLREAATVLGTTRMTDTVHAAFRDVIDWHHRADLARREVSEPTENLPALPIPVSEA